MTYENQAQSGTPHHARPRIPRAARFTAALPLFVALGCDSQVGPEYTGESLFALRGTVVLEEPRSESIVPALAFVNGYDYVLVDGYVQGRFPAEFRFDVTEPPPESALFPLSGTVKGGWGQIVVVPAEHSRRMPGLRTSSSSECDDDGLCTKIEDKCTEEGVCLTRTLSCRNELCELVDSSGDPAVLEDRESQGETSFECAGDVCLTVLQHCVPGNACYREIRSCDRARESETTTLWTDGYEVCELLSESGDASLTEFEDLERPARDFNVLYVTQRMSVPGFGTLPQGYSLFERTAASDSQRIASLGCVYDAKVEAVDLYNAEHGTEYVAHGVIDDADAEESILAEEERLAAECPEGVGYELISEPLERELTLRLGRGTSGAGF